MKLFHWIFLMAFALCPAFADELSMAKRPRKPPTTQEMPESPKAGYEVKQGQIPAGYNHAAGIDTSGWDLHFNLAFLYWEANQDGMSLARPRTLPGVFFNDTVVYQRFSYKPGFKIEAGFKSNSWDDWGGLIEYTRMHGTYHNSASAPAGGEIVMGPWFSNQSIVVASSFTSTWDNDLDVIDFGLFRTYYVGKRLIFTTYFGGRGGWLDQRLVVAANMNGMPAGLANPRFSNNTSDSWFIGPRAALKTGWMIGKGFRLVGNSSVSLCYQSYKVRHSQDETNDPAQLGVSTNVNVAQLRPNCGLQVGFGWGNYAWGQRTHFDFQATYDFNAWFQQNMIRMLANETGFFIENAAGSLYFHGLTLRGQVNF